jgi:hypothetical protein
VFALALALVAALWRSQKKPPAPTNHPSPGGAALRRTRHVAEASVRASTRTRARPSPARVTAAPDATNGGFAGRVLSLADGRGIPGATLTFTSDGASAEVSAGPDGAFVYTPSRAGDHSLLLVRANGYVPFSPEASRASVAFVARSGARVTGVVIPLEPVLEYTVRVETPDGAPLAHATVRALDDEANERVTDAQGEARLLTHDDAMIEARHAAYRLGRAPVDFSAQIARRVTVRLRARDDAATDLLTGRATLAGCVRDEHGEVVEEALVHARRPSDDDGAHPDAVAVTGADGCFRLSGLDPGAHAVQVTSPCCALWTGRAEAPGEGLVVTLGRGFALRGAVRDAETGRPVAGSVVIATRTEGAVELGASLSASVFDSEGRYELRGLRAGPHVVVAVADGYAPSPERRVEVSTDGAAVDFALTRGARCTGRVTDARTKLAVGGARVSLEGRLGAQGAVPTLAQALTDAQGVFVLTGLAPGLHSVSVAADGHHARLFSGLDVPASGVLGPFEWELTPTEAGEAPRIELVGIGAVLSGDGDALRVNEVVAGGGAAEAGITPGDHITHLDGTPVATWGFQGSIQRIRGPEGSVVRLTLARGDAGVTEVNVRRRRIAR